MTYCFAFDVTDDTEISLIGPVGRVPFERWPAEAPANLRAGVDIALRLEGTGSAIAIDDVLMVEHATIAGLSVHEATSLGLPASAEAVAAIATRGDVTQPNYELMLHWQRVTGQPLVGVRRVGAWLRIGQECRRLSEPLFSIAEAVDAARSVGTDPGARLAAVARLLELLPDAQTGGAARAKGMLGNIRVHVADAFSLDLTGDGEGTQLVPILHRAGGDADARLLTEPLQQVFVDQFRGFANARTVYTLGGGALLVLSPPLRGALAAVRRLQAAAPATRKAVFTNPRLYLREVLGDEQETLIEELFRETSAYSERVTGLGLWQKRVVPWIQVARTDWFDGAADDGCRSTSPAPGGLVIDGRRVELTPAQADDLRLRIEQAIVAGQPDVELVDGDAILRIPAGNTTLADLARLEKARAPRPGDAGGSRPPPAEVLLILPNEQDVEVEALVARRPTPTTTQTGALATRPKPHQAEGVDWLQKAWSEGLPGVLLADDMGLGKTLQGLTFLAWLRHGMEEGTVPREPVLVVAPTGLLENWRKEHAEHLRAPGLGDCLAAYGIGLRPLQRADVGGRRSLNIEALREADWVLTTYETLRDYDRDFGQVRFAAAIFDEAQKIKTPAIRLTDAAKAMNIGFRIAMTGTPVENRLSDLWCIVDAVNSGYLGDLKSFSREYEGSPDPDRLGRLRETLTRPTGIAAPLLLRRLRRERLPDLPALEERQDVCAMPRAQAGAYAAAIADARRGDRGQVLAALQRLRGISLHPEPDAGSDDGQFIASSARIGSTIAVLDRISAAEEAALLFLEDLNMQARLAAVIQRRYRLAAPPMVINGSVAGNARQARVDRFQAGNGFDVMILSPKAGGVGLTLTRANHVIHVSRWWNPAVEDQCNGRALRIGQVRPVTVHLPIAILPGGGRSFDQNLHALLERKRQLMHDALLPPEANDFEKQQLLDQTIDGYS